MRYRPGAPYQYTELEMALKVWGMAQALAMNRLRHGRYLDILISHSPPFGIHDGEDTGAPSAFRRCAGWPGAFGLATCSTATSMLTHQRRASRGT